MGLELAKAFISIRGDSSKLPGDLNNVKGQVMQAATELGAMIGGVFLVKSAVAAAAAFEQTTVAFKTMLGSAEETAELMTDLTEFAALTPFEMPEILQATRGLVQFGERGTELMETLNVLGDAAAGTSSSFGMLAMVFNQVRGVGKLMTQDFRQLSTRGVISLQDIADYYEVTTMAAQQMLSKGKISFGDLKKILKGLTEEGGRFFNMMEEQSRTLTGRWSTLKDAAAILSREIAMPLIGALKGALNVGIHILENYGTLVKTLGKMTLAIGLTVAAVKLFSAALMVAAKSSIILQAMSGPKGWVVIAAGFAAATIALKGLNDMVNEMGEEFDEAADGVNKLEEGLEGIVDKESGLESIAEAFKDINDSIPKVGDLQNLFGEIAKGTKNLDPSTVSSVFNSEALSSLKEMGKAPGSFGKDVRSATILVGSLQEYIDVLAKAREEEKELGVDRTSEIKNAEEQIKRYSASIYSAFIELERKYESKSLRLEGVFGNIQEAVRASRSAIESVMTPQEKYKMSVVETSELLVRGLITSEQKVLLLKDALDELNKSMGHELPESGKKFFKEMGIGLGKLTKDLSGFLGTGIESTTKALASVMPETGTPILEVGRVGFADLGRQLQDSLLRKDGPQEKLLAVAERSEKREIESVEWLKKIAGKVGFSILSK